MKKVIFIPDSFKGTMSSEEICEIMKTSVHKFYPEAETISIPVADGGEGSVDAFLAACGGEKIWKKVTGPWGEEVEGYYGIMPDNTAIVEMAAAASLPMVGDKKDPSKTTTFGVGELILAAAAKGCKKIIVGLGGSATNDGGCGMASACGVKFINKENQEFVPVGDNLTEIVKIDTTGIAAELKNVEFVTMCDIDNPFFGKEGAAAIYGPQKGADEAMVAFLDKNMMHLADVIKKDIGIEVQDIPGSGAAGGMGGGMVAFLSSPLQMGIETVLDTVKFDTLIEGADYIFTGEGKIDGQSLRGKVVIGVAKQAVAKGIKVMAIVGDIGDGAENAYNLGVTGIFSINRVAVPYKEAKPRAKSDLALTMDNLMRVL